MTSIADWPADSADPAEHANQQADSADWLKPTFKSDLYHTKLM